MRPAPAVQGQCWFPCPWTCRWPQGNFSFPAPWPVARPVAPEAEIAAAVNLLFTAERPVILAGGGVSTSRAQRPLQHLAELLSASGTPRSFSWANSRCSVRYWPQSYRSPSGRPFSMLTVSAIRLSRPRPGPW
ncbi:MAG: hypothetical protein D9V47_00125 [Clostridia bacterium]|nr:MAG: hypothetical protein D9V47_00125 [Clostridia bacterium]